MKPDWFVVGAGAWFRGFHPETKIISIDEKSNSWVGEDVDGQHCYPLDEVSEHWKNQPTNE